MPDIAPISDLRNYGQILEKVKPSSPVYLTKNGRGVYGDMDEVRLRSGALDPDWRNLKKRKQWSL